MIEFIKTQTFLHFLKVVEDLITLSNLYFISLIWTLSFFVLHFKSWPVQRKVIQTVLTFGAVLNFLFLCCYIFKNCNENLKFEDKYIWWNISNAQKIETLLEWIFTEPKVINWKVQWNINWIFICCRFCFIFKLKQPLHHVRVFLIAVNN